MSKSSHPPKLFSRFLSWFCDPDLYEDVSGDLSEIFAQKYSENPLIARLWYVVSVLRLLRPGVVRSVSFFKINLHIMLTNYILIALRNALKYKSYTFLNLLGLVIGISSALMIALWVNDEIQVDEFHENGDRVFQLFRNMQESEGAVRTTVSIPKPAGDLMSNTYSEVDQVAYVSWEMPVRLSHGDNHFSSSGRSVSDAFFDLFSFKMLMGNESDLFNQLNEILLSRDLAMKIFGSGWEENAVGSAINFDGETEMIVAGVFENPGAHSSMQFDWLIPADFFINHNSWVNDWGNGSFRVYFTLKDDSQIEAVRIRIFDEINSHTDGNAMAGEETLVAYKFSDYYLHSNFENGVKSGGRIVYVRIMFVAAVFLLLIAIINFVNLATARSGRRSKEVGVRKVLGAHKQSIGVQFLVESLVTSVVALSCSLIVVMLCLPYFREMTGKHMELNLLDAQVLIFVGVLIVVLTVLSGAYPAFLISRFKISSALRGSVRHGNAAGFLRRGLVVFQFGVSMLLLIGTGVVYAQLDYILTKDLGLNKENLLIVQLKGDLNKKLETYRSELNKIPQVTKVTFASGNPVQYGRSTSSANWEGKSSTAGYEVNVMLTDKDFVHTMGMEMVSGRDFETDLNDSTNFLINEVTAAIMGFEDPVGKRLSFWGINGKVIGVIKNFHMRDLYTPIAPLIVTCIDPSHSEVALIRVSEASNEAILAVEEVTKTMNPVDDFEYSFLDKDYAAAYENERVVGVLFRIFAIISIIISCLGLLGLSAYTAELRSKELSIRRVHGASIFQLITILSMDYIKLMILAFVVATPVAYYMSSTWLANFQFSISLSSSVFLAAALLIFTIGILTVGYRSYLAARVNPATSLKSE